MDPIQVRTYRDATAEAAAQSLHKEVSTGRLDQATSNARDIASGKKPRFYRDAAGVNKDELAWLANHQPHECYAIEYEVWRTATQDLCRIHKKAAKFAKVGNKAGLRRMLKRQKAAVRLMNTAHSAFSDCPDLTVPAIHRSTASPIIGRWVTTKDYVDGDGRHFFLRIHSEVSRNGNLLARDKQGIGCQGLGLGIVPVTMRGRGEFFTERGLRPLSGSPGFRWDSAKVHCYPRGGRQPKLLTSGAADTYWYDESADIVYAANGNCYWREKTGSPKDCKAFWRGTPAKSDHAVPPTE